VLLAGEGLSRTDLARDSGLSKATVTRVVDELIGEGLVRQADEVPTGQRGRRAVELELAAELGLACGVDMGATNTRVVVSDLGGRPVAVRRVATPPDLDAAGLARWLAGHVQRENLWATSIGVPGVVDPATDAISASENLPAVEGPEFARAVRAALPGRVVFDNDANAALLGELAFGAGRGRRSVVVFTIGTGVGAGVACDGQLVRGRSGFVGEFGYLPVGGAEPLTLEQAAGGAHLERRARERGIELAELFAPDAPPAAAELRRDAERALVTAFAAATAAYEPELIVIGGRVGEALAGSIPAMQRALDATMAAAPELLPAECGDAAGCLGALVRALELAYARLGLDEDGRVASWIAERVDAGAIA
jgi:predicted NBD/HSP70 family sugar kinase